MNNKVLFGATLAAVFTVSMMMTPAFAGVAIPPWLDFTSEVKSDDNELKAKIDAAGTISKDGTDGAFGYGIITDAGLTAILVSTTHAGVLDSEEQDGVNDAEWHTHYVALKIGESPGCSELEVVDITWEAPGDIWVKNDLAIFDGPKSFDGTHSLSGADISFAAGDVIGATVSFTIDPVDGTGTTNPADIQAVCIDDVNIVAPSGTLGKGNAKP